MKMPTILLSKRQREVLEFLANGHAPKNAQDVLGISYGSFKVHANAVYTKMRARNSAHAVAIAMREGIIK